MSPETIVTEAKKAADGFAILIGGMTGAAREAGPGMSAQRQRDTFERLMDTLTDDLMVYSDEARDLFTSECRKRFYGRALPKDELAKLEAQSWDAYAALSRSGSHEPLKMDAA